MRKQREKTIMLYFPSARGVRHSLGSRTSLCVYSGGQEDRHCHKESFLSSSPSPAFFCWAWCHYIWNIPWVDVGQLLWLCHPTHLLPTPNLLALGRLEAWLLCQHCSAITKHWCDTSVVVATEHSTAWTAVGRLNSIPARPSTCFTDSRIRIKKIRKNQKNPALYSARRKCIVFFWHVQKLLF